MTEQTCPHCGVPMEYSWGEPEWPEAEVCTMSMYPHHPDGPECRALVAANKRIEELEREIQVRERALDVLAAPPIHMACFANTVSCLWGNEYPCDQCNLAYAYAVAEAELEAENGK